MWQYITLMKRIYLIDCPGVVPPSQGDSEQDILLKGVVRVENVEHPAQYVEAVLRRTQTRHIERTYDIRATEYNDDAIEFLSSVARKGGRLLKGGEPDVDGVAKMVLNDFLRGKIPWFTAPPKKEGAENVAENAATTEVVEGREGRLGEMPGKRKVDAMIANEAPVANEEGQADDAASSNDHKDGNSTGSEDANDDTDAFETFDDENDEPTNDSEGDAHDDGGTQL